MRRRALGRDWLPIRHAQKTSGVEIALDGGLAEEAKTATLARLCFFSLRSATPVLGETTARRVVNFMIFFVENSRDKRYYAK